jgi:hypothetical protein
MNESVVVALLVVNSAWTDDDCFLVHFPVEKHKPNAVFFYSCLVDIFFRGQVGTLLLSYELLNEPCLPSFHGFSFIQWLGLDCNSSIPTE